MGSLEAILDQVIDDPLVPNPDVLDFHAKNLAEEVKEYEEEDERREPAKLNIFESKLQAAYSYQQRKDHYKAGHSFERASNVAREFEDYEIQLKLLILAEENFGRAQAMKQLAHVHLKMAICYQHLGQTEDARSWYELAESGFEGFEKIPTYLFSIADKIIPKKREN